MAELKLIKVVAVKHVDNDHAFLFEAPYNQILKPGDTVIVDTKFGEAGGKVVVCDSFLEDSAAFKFIIAASGATLPLRRVLKRLVEYVMDYPDEGEQDAENNDCTSADNKEEQSADID